MNKNLCLNNSEKDWLFKVRSVLLKPYSDPDPEPEPKPDYTEPFYVENITQEEETLSIVCYDEWDEYSFNFLVEYSTDKITWESLGTTGEITLTKSLQPGDKVYLRATTDTWAPIDFESDWYRWCTISGISKVGGNIMSLIYGSSFTGNETLFPNESLYNFQQLFGDSSELIDASKLILPATTLADYCYSDMFNGCTSLTTAPKLPATTLSGSCYSSMFYGCTSLTTAPKLPATTLSGSCYSSMFNGCTSLTTAPELPATTLADYCYSDMFNGCTSLNQIECLATNISATNCTSNWVSGVSSTGTFIKAPSMNNWTTGNGGIPSGWTIQDAT